MFMRYYAAQIFTPLYRLVQLDGRPQGLGTMIIQFQMQANHAVGTAVCKLVQARGAQGRSGPDPLYQRGHAAHSVGFWGPLPDFWRVPPSIGHDPQEWEDSAHHRAPPISVGTQGEGGSNRAVPPLPLALRVPALSLRPARPRPPLLAPRWQTWPRLRWRCPTSGGLHATGRSS